MRLTRGERLGALLGLLVCGAATVLALRLAVPPAPRPATAPADEFSAERARRHVEAIAAQPHPPGTDEHRRVAEYLLNELRSLGLQPSVQEGWAVHGRGARVVAARARNLLARLEGTQAGPALLLLTHYDSVPTGPGAGDDAAGVAAVLEALRALVEAPDLRNDVIVLITDGEESGLLGARLFVEEHPWAADIGLVLNFEARGNRGLVNMFETSAGNGRLVRGMASASPYPFASSISYEVYRRMPNDTDLTVFLEAGYPGLNFAMIGNHAAYHTELDTAVALSPASLQHQGSHVLALTRHFGRLDLSDLESEDSVYFNPLGSRLVVYSTLVGKVLAVLAVVALLATILWGKRRGRLAWAGVRGGFWAWLMVVAGAAVAMGALWNVFERLFPAALATPYGEPYAADTIRLAALLVTLSLAALVGSMLQLPTALELLAGLLVAWAMLGWVVALLVPGAGYLFAWPAIAGVLGLAAALTIDSPAWRGALQAAGALVASLIFAPIIVLVTEALQVNAAVVLGAVLAVPVTLVLPALRTTIGDRLRVPVGVAIVGLALFAWVGWRAGPSAATPAPTSLAYLMDEEGSEAWWLSYEARVDEWTAQVLPEGIAPRPMPEFMPGSDDTLMLRAAALPLELPGPTAELVGDTLEDDVRLLQIRVRSPRGAPFLTIAPDTSMATLLAIGVGDRLIEVDDSARDVALTLENVPAEGVIVAIQTLDRQPVAIDVIDWSWGLPGIDGVPLEARPASLLRRPRWMTDSVQVRRKYWF